MSELLDELIKLRKEDALKYEQYLKEIEELTKKVKQVNGQDKYPKSLESPSQKAFYDNFANDEELSLTIDETVKYTAKDGWRGNPIKKRELEQAVKKKLPEELDIEFVMEIISNQNEY